MSAEPSSQKEPSGLRPLPSVKMALLPDELRARRAKRLLFGTMLGVVVLALLLLWIARSVIPQTWAWMEEALGRQDAQLAADLGVTDGLLPGDADSGVDEGLSEEEALAPARSRPNAS